MKRGVLIALSGGLASAVLYLAFRTNTAGVLILTYLTPLPILLIGLSKGLNFGVIAAVLAIVTIFLMTGPMATGLYCILVAVRGVCRENQARSSKYEASISKPRD